VLICPHLTLPKILVKFGRYNYHLMQCSDTQNFGHSHPFGAPVDRNFCIRVFTCSDAKTAQ
jgi:hypothetical protein